MFPQENFEPAAEYEIDVSVNFDGDKSFEQKQTVRVATMAVGGICSIKGTQAYSLASGEERELEVVFQNILDAQVGEYAIEWACLLDSVTPIPLAQCLELSEQNTRAVLLNPDQYTHGHHVAVAATATHPNYDGQPYRCMTRVFIHKQDIQILETDFFLVGAGNDFTTDFQAYITPLDHIFIYCQHAIPPEDSIKIEYDWYEIAYPQEVLSKTVKSHKSFSREQMQDWKDGL